MSERTACKLLSVERSSYRYEPRPDRNAELRDELVKLARQKPRYGYRRLHALLSRRGYEVNVKRVYRLYVEERLMVRRRRRKRLVRDRAVEPRLLRPNQEWAMDFIVDGLATGRMVRVLSVVDAYTRECLALEADTSLGSGRVTRVLERLIGERGRPENLLIRSTDQSSNSRRIETRARQTSRSGWCISSPAVPCRTATWRASMAGCATSASTQAGSARSTPCGVLWQPGVRSTTASARTARSTIAPHRSSNMPSKEEGPWPLFLRQPQPSTQLRNSSYEWMRKRGQVTGRPTTLPVLNQDHYVSM